MNDAWHIRSRSPRCSATGRAFEDEEPIYAAIFRQADSDDFDRQDFCVEAWEARRQDAEAPQPYSFWRSTFEVPEESGKKQEVVAKESAEALLRRLIEEDVASSENARYILALMLERKKTLKPVDTKEGEGSRLLFYEHAKSGEVFIVRDPLLNLAEIDAIQEEVAGWLGAKPGNSETTGAPSEAGSGPETGAEGGRETVGGEGEGEGEANAAPVS